NKLLMQIYSDVTGMPIKIANSTITPAIGSAMYGSVAAGANNFGYDSITQAANSMSSSVKDTYRPNDKNKKKYDIIYKEYKKLVQYFSKQNNLMKKLKEI